ncbi:transcriptional regulator [Streptantibioticus parmotrematis]|uniref:transcriptional regulator n=1 Tax=Streptantibioticus parmotrematis TaxID=2873249 RepID=UPI0033DE6290
MYDIAVRRHALSLLSQGRSLSSVSRETGVSRAAVRAWRARAEPLRRQRGCDACAGRPRRLGPDYAYLLGLYLGDGCLSAHPRTGGHYLRVACANAWPGLIDACERAVRAVRPGAPVSRVPCPGHVSVVSHDRHWPCLFPQHAPGMKHERPIALESWQREIVTTHPWEFLRGLIHSDGCRTTNWTERVVDGERRRYEYPRYFFTNKSADIRRLCTGTMDALGVRWRQAGPYNISVARRSSVALMDAYVGPKR